MNILWLYLVGNQSIYCTWELSELFLSWDWWDLWDFKVFRCHLISKMLTKYFPKSFLVRLLENTWLLSVYYIEYNQMSINGMINRWTLMDPVILSFTFIYNSTTFSHRKLKGKVLLLWIKVHDKIMRSIYVHTYF